MYFPSWQAIFICAQNVNIGYTRQEIFKIFAQNARTAINFSAAIGAPVHAINKRIYIVQYIYVRVDETWSKK